MERFKFIMFDRFNDYECPFSLLETQFRKICLNGDIRQAKLIIDYYHKNSLEDISLKFIAIEYDNVEIFKLLYPLRDEIDMSDFNYIINRGSYNIAKYVCNSTINMFLEDFLTDAADKGHLKIFKWLYSSLDPKQKLNMKEIYDIACVKGQLNVIRWILTHVDNKMLKTIDLADGFISVTGEEYTDSVKYMLDNNIVSIYDHELLSECFRLAKELKSYDTLEILSKVSPFLKYDNDTTDIMICECHTQHKRRLCKKILKQRNKLRFKPGNMGYLISEIDFKLKNGVSEENIFKEYTNVMNYICIQYPSQIKEKVEEYLNYI